MVILRPKHVGAHRKVISVVCCIPSRALRSKFKKVPILAQCYDIKLLQFKYYLRHNFDPFWVILRE